MTKELQRRLGCSQDAAYKASRSVTPDDETEDESSTDPEDAEPASAAADQGPSELLRQFISQVKARMERDKIPASAPEGSANR
jgi:hypothetical protein